jgi:hypothetical protein
MARLKKLSESMGRNGILANEKLLEAITSVCSKFDRCRIVIDALGESTDQHNLMEAIMP